MLSHTNEPCTSRCVASLITTVFGCAAAWMRAARLGTLPTTNGWRLAPKPISLASTMPLSMPTRTCSRAAGAGSAGSRNPRTISTAAPTAARASCPCADG